MVLGPTVLIGWFRRGSEKWRVAAWSRGRLRCPIQSMTGPFSLRQAALSEQRPVFGSSPILRRAPLGNNRNYCVYVLAACSKGQFVQAGIISEGHKGERRVVWEEWSRIERHSLCRRCYWVRFSRRLVEIGSLMRLPARSQAKNRRYAT